MQDKTVAAVLVCELRTADLGSRNVLQCKCLEIELDKIVNPVGIEFEIQEVTASRCVAEPELRLIRQFGIKVRVASEAESVSRVRRPEGMAEAGIQRPAIAQCERVLGIPGRVTAEGFVVACSQGDKTPVAAPRPFVLYKHSAHFRVFVKS